MANDNIIKKFTASDIEKYHKGQLAPNEMHALEKAALEDPFLADALEGYATPGIQINEDIADLKNRLAEKREEAKLIPIHAGHRTSFPWLKVAVMIVAIAGAGLLANQFLFQSSSPKTIAESKSRENEKVQQQTTDQADKLSQPAKDSLNNSTASITQKVNANAAGNSEEKNQATQQADGSSKVVPGSSNRNSELADLKVPTNIAPQGSEEYKQQNEASKTLRNDNPVVSAEIVLKDDVKSKEAGRNAGEEKNKEDAIASERVVNAKGITNSNRNNQAYRNNNFFRGQVTDANNHPLPFANITNTTDNVGTYTDSKGNFTLVSPYDSVMNVQVRALGFENNRLQLRSDVSTNQVMLQEDRSIAPRVLDTVKRNYAIRSRDGNMTFEEPEPADGWAYYDNYLFNNLNPESYDVKKTPGRDAVELSFEVNKYGDPVNIKIEKSLCDKCDKEAIRLIKEGPKWKRKAKKGKRTTVTVPFIKPD